jgi:3D (Asp-Asp-Asp) domain-containing protein
MNVNKILDHLMTIFAIIVLGIVGIAVTAEACDEPFIVNSTAYANPAGNPTYSGRPTVEGRTLAGKTEWIGSVAALYEINEDDSIGEFIGYREVEDTGYGVASVKVPGMGTIETGETVDLFIEDREEAIQYGERKIYIQIIDGEG